MSEGNLVSNGLTSLIGRSFGRGVSIVSESQGRLQETKPHNNPYNYSQLLEVLPVAVYTCDVNGRVLFYNEAAAKLWGRRPEIGKDLWCGSEKIFDLDGTVLTLDNCPMAIAIRERRPVRDKEIIVECEDGTRRHIIPNPEPLFDDSGNFIGAINTLIDVTESQKILRENEEQFRTLANSIPQMVWIADKFGYANWYNQRWYDYTGTDFSDMQARGWEKFHHPDHLQRVCSHLTHCLETGEIWEDTFPLRSKYGEYRWFLSRAYPVRDEGGRIVRWFGTNTDITERLEIEEESKEADRRKDEFLANMSHELRTPMNAIIGIGHILSQSSPLTKKQVECIKTLQSSSETLLSLINNLLDLAKIENETIKLENISFSLREVIEEVLIMLHVSALEKKITLELDYDKHLQDKYIGDPHRFKQIILNLVSNAVKFTERGGVKVIIRLARETHNLANIAVHVIDTGIGIPDSNQRMIFNKFSQGDCSISRRYGGTGLGLTISKTLAELMGGEITVESREGAGSEFTLYLPLAPDRSVASNLIPPVEVSARHSPVPLAHSADAPLLLIVEDYKPNLLVVASYLEMLGYNYETAQNGYEAVHQIRTGSFNAVLMDVQMPDMDGLTATRAIRKWENTNNLKPTPIIGITAYALVGDKEKCLEAGMDDYLSKPFTPEMLQSKLETLLDKVSAFYQLKSDNTHIADAH